MTQITSGIRRILDEPWIYSLLKKLIGGARLERAFVSEYLTTKPGQRVLDVGCGPKGYISMLGDVDYLGIDISEEYVVRARLGSGGRGRFQVGSASQLRALGEESFDLVIAVGLLHHLDDEEVDTLLQDSAVLLNPGGRLITLDNVYTDQQSALARYLISRDRGQNVRTQIAYEALGKGIFNTIDSSIRDDMLRIPYTHIITRWSDPIADSHR